MNTYNETYQQNDGGQATQQREGKVARSIERQTAKIPSDLFLWGAGAAMVGSLLFQLLGPKPSPRIFGLKRQVEGRAPIAMFVGQWVPTLLLLGIYNKIVKVGGSDRLSR